jgi:hypothetical protein
MRSLSTKRDARGSGARTAGGASPGSALDADINCGRLRDALSASRERMRRIGELVGGRQPRIAEAIAAAARRGPLTLLESIETAGHHLRRHILAAVFASGCRCRGRDKGHRGKRRKVARGSISRTSGSDQRSRRSRPSRISNCEWKDGTCDTSWLGVLQHGATL